MECLNKVRIRNESNTAWEAEPWFVFATGQHGVAVYQTMDTPIRYMHRDMVTPWKEMCIQCETYLQTVGSLCQECAKSRDQQAGRAAEVPAHGVVCSTCRAPAREHLRGQCLYCYHREPFVILPKPKVYPYADQDQQWATPQDES